MGSEALVPQRPKKKSEPAKDFSRAEKKELAAQYGWSLATLNSVPELRRLFKSAVDGNYTPAKFVAELRDTKWFQKNSESQRKYLVLKTTDPKTFKSTINQRMASISNLWKTMGGSPPSRQTLAKLADQSLRLGLNDDQINERVSRSINWNQQIAKNTIRGTGAAQLSELRKMAGQYGVSLGNQWYGNALEAIAGNDATLEGYQNSIKEMAKKRYSQFADELDSGLTMNDVIEPYKQSMASLLEVNPRTIDMSDAQLKSMLSYRVADKKGRGIPAQMSLTDFEDNLRRDSRWQYTQNARDKGMSVVDNLLTRWGVKA